MAAHSRFVEPCAKRLGVAPQVFMSNAATAKSCSILSEWLQDQMTWSGAKAIASAPDFNVKNARYEAVVQRVNTACFGTMLTKAVLSLFELDAMKTTAAKLQFKLPRPVVNTVVQSRMSNLLELTSAIRTQFAGSAEALHAANRLDDFANFVSAGNWGVSTTDDWVALLSRKYGCGWQDLLHVDDVLRIFRFPADVLEFCATAKHRGRTWRDYAVRWVPKGFQAFGLPGSLSDLVNLIRAVMKRDLDEQLSIEQVVAMVEEFKKRIEEDDLADLWVPTHMVHDAEMDDMLALTVATYLREKMGGELEVLVQLPQDPALTTVKTNMETKLEKTQVFFDSSACNQQAVRQFWGL